MRATRQMALTPDLVAQVHRALEDPGPDPNWIYHSDEDYDSSALILGLRLPHWCARGEIITA
jgi:cation transport protein ChaC